MRKWQPINELLTSPLSPQLIASGSEDGTVRLWSLDDEHQTQPCAVICTGEGYQGQIQTVVGVGGPCVLLPV